MFQYFRTPLTWCATSEDVYPTVLRPKRLEFITFTINFCTSQVKTSFTNRKWEIKFPCYCESWFTLFGDHLPWNTRGIWRNENRNTYYLKRGDLSLIKTIKTNAGPTKSQRLIQNVYSTDTKDSTARIFHVWSITSRGTDDTHGTEIHFLISMRLVMMVTILVTVLQNVETLSFSSIPILISGLCLETSHYIVTIHNPSSSFHKRNIW
jgi:hypothetical protein